MPIFENVTRRKIKNGDLALGMGVRQSRTADHALICKACGFDWIFVDLEHTSLSVEQASNICCAALAAGVTPFVRVASHAHHDATRYLDTGALGVIVPDVDTPEQAETAARNCRFPPAGRRSIPGAITQLGFELMPIKDMMSAVNREVMIVVMLESPQAIENADAIAAVEGVDAIMIGGADLSTRFGFPGDFNAPAVQAAFDAMQKAAARHGKISGFAGVTDEKAQLRFIAQGARLVQCGMDIGFLQSAASAKVNVLRGSQE